MNSKSVLITGASGFIGTHVLQLLIKGDYEIHAVSRSFNKDDLKNKIYWHQIDLLNTDSIDALLIKLNPYFLMHLAWKVGKGFNYDSKENTKWLSVSKNLIKSFYQNGGKRVLVSGSCAEYDWSYNIFTEKDTPLNPSNNYGRSKKELFTFLESYCKKHNYSFIWPRIFFSFGPNQNKKSLVPFVINNLIENEVVKTTQGHQKFDYLFIEDMALAMVLLLESEYIGAVNIASGKSTQLKWMIFKIAEFFNKEDLIQLGEMPYSSDSPEIIIGNNDLLKKITNWKQENSIEEGLIKTINNFLNK